jgi:hypothetical protein
MAHSRRSSADGGQLTVEGRLRVRVVEWEPSAVRVVSVSSARSSLDEVRGVFFRAVGGASGRVDEFRDGRELLAGPAEAEDDRACLPAVADRDDGVLGVVGGLAAVVVGRAAAGRVLGAAEAGAATAGCPAACGSPADLVDALLLACRGDVVGVAGAAAADRVAVRGSPAEVVDALLLACRGEAAGAAAAA